jgi:aerobic-type carbon monoxide dehydrogenase small subunit (CoxS/CutS family)
MTEKSRVSIKVNGRMYESMVEPSMHLADFLRHEINLTGTHVGCEHGVCGACTVLVNGVSVRSCLMFAVQADGCEVETIEGVVEPNGALTKVQIAMSENHALQCGFCTPGVVMTLIEFLRENQGKTVSEHDVRRALSGTLCRCTGYQGMVDAAMQLLGRTTMEV